jgi:hypothetical protein
MTAHSEAHQWYIRTVAGAASGGFHRSPFKGGDLADKSNGGGGSWLLAQRAPQVAADPWEGFSTYGSVLANGSQRTLTEDVDAGLFKEMTFPVATALMTFEFQFVTPSDGDFFRVTFGDEVLYQSANLSVTRSAFLRAEISLSHLIGDTGLLEFTLVSRGEANAVLHLKDLAFVENPDVDGDGISNDDEIANGTNPLSWDTDGDRIADNDEAPASPLLADTDGDGADDLAERLAGTIATDGTSLLHPTALDIEPTGIRLRWQSVPGKRYQLIRSQDPGFTTFEEISPVLDATGAETEFFDTSAQLWPVDRGFFRIDLSSE